MLLRHPHYPSHPHPLSRHRIPPQLHALASIAAVEENYRCVLGAEGKGKRCCGTCGSTQRGPHDSFEGKQRKLPHIDCCPCMSRATAGAEHSLMGRPNALQLERTPYRIGKGSTALVWVLVSQIVQTQKTKECMIYGYVVYLYDDYSIRLAASQFAVAPE